jgi:hypothetical protein
VLERLRRWTADTRRVDIAAAVNVEVRDTAHGERNRVRIDHRLPAPGDSAEWRFRVTTHRQMLPSAHFDPAVRRKVHEAAQERGRRIFAIERTSQEVVAVLSYHLDENQSRPLLITALGTRCDAEGPRELFAVSLALAWLLKQYAHAIAEQTGRGAHVDMDASTKPRVVQTLRMLGFRNAPRVPGFVPSGRHLRQDPISRR